jgi:hypothetical protein
MTEKRGVNRNVVIILVTICAILTIGLIWAIISYTSIINEKNNTINSLNIQISNFEDQITNLQYQITHMQVLIKNLNDVFNLNGTATAKISWFNAWTTPDETKLNITATIVNYNNIPVEKVSLIVKVLFYNNTVERSTNYTIDIERLGIGDWYSLQKTIDVPEGKGWHFSVDFILYINGAETDHQSFGCY